VDDRAIETLLLGRLEAVRAGDLQKVRDHHGRLMELLDPVPEAAFAREQMRRRMSQFERIMSPAGLPLCTAEALRSALPGRHPGRWQAKVKERQLTGNTTKARFADLALPLWLPGGLELTGVVELENVRDHPHARIRWSILRASASQLTFCPKQSKLELCVAGSDYRRATQIDYATPLPFCLRVRGDKAAVFARFGEKPDFTASGVDRPCGRIVLWCDSAEGKATCHFRDLVLRHLPADRPLDAPVRLPRASSTRPASGPKDW
jgi:hypothetical protein